MPRILTVASLLFALTLCVPASAMAGKAHVAVAANFTAAAKELATVFADATGHEAVLSFGSTGKLYAQIAHGAPFEVFLAADSVRPQRAEVEGLAVAGSRFTYARGRLVLWSRDGARLDGSPTALKAGAFSRLAIANPKTAPYGAAARETLTVLGLWETVRARVVRGENIAQTYQFVATGNAEMGFVARSQTVLADGGSEWPVPETLHSPIRQEAVLLVKGAGNPVARDFLSFMASEAARAVIARHGYDTE